MYLERYTKPELPMSMYVNLFRMLISKFIDQIKFDRFLSANSLDWNREQYYSHLLKLPTSQILKSDWFGEENQSASWHLEQKPQWNKTLSPLC